MFESLESLGGNIQCASSRETLMYQSATFNSAVPSAMGVLAETIRDPLIKEDEVQQQLETADYEIGEIWSKPELILPELVHVAAYKGNTLGNPLLCPKERLAEINRTTIQRYRQAFYQPERMVVAFAGVPHDQAVKLTEEYFGSMKSTSLVTDASLRHSNSTTSPQQEPTIPHPSTYASSGAAASTVPPTPTQEPSRLLSKIPFFKNLSTSASSHATVTDPPSSTSTLLSETAPLTTSTPLSLNTPSHYTGGFLALPPLPPPPNPALPPLTHIHIAFESLPISSTRIYALAVLQTLLGGGGSFSAGGPGKGMYSRLFTSVLNRYGWIESCVAFNHSYTDSGLFGISASCSPSETRRMVEVICRELKALTLPPPSGSGVGGSRGGKGLEPEEVMRAKNQLRSSLLMNLESRMVELEDLGRQVQCHGHKTGVQEMCARIEALTPEDLREVAEEVMTGAVANAGAGSGAPTVVVQEGEEEGKKTSGVEWGEIQERIARWGLGRH